MSISHGSSSARAPVVWSGWESVKIGVFIMGPLGPIRSSQLQKASVVEAGFDLIPGGGGLLRAHPSQAFLLVANT